FFLSVVFFFFFSSRRRHTRSKRDWSSDVCSSDLFGYVVGEIIQLHRSFVFLVPMLLFGILILVTNVLNDPYMFTFYIKESSLLLFSFKVFGSIFLFWLIAIFSGSRLEVHQS